MAGDQSANADAYLKSRDQLWFATLKITELCRQQGITMSLYYSRLNEFLEAGKKRLAGGTVQLIGSISGNSFLSPRGFIRRSMRDPR